MSDEEQDTKAADRVDVGGDLVTGDKYVENNYYVSGDDERFAEAEAHGVELRRYLDDLLEEVGTIKIPGIRTRAGEALPPEPIEQLYTPLRSKEIRGREMGRVAPAEARVADERGDADGESEAQRVTLAELLSEHRHLLLIGQPGAGKSTFSDLVVCMLARDLVGARTPATAAADDDKAEDEPAQPWRTEYLGLSPERAPPLPALLRVRDLVGVLAREEECGESRRPDDFGWILRLLARRTQPTDASVDRGHDVRVQQWRDWLDAEGGDGALLILDGLDEAANTSVHERVVKIIRSACRQWSACRIIVTSRPFGVEGLLVRGHGFHRAEIDDFGPEEIELFVGKWSRAIYARAQKSAGKSARNLVEAIRGREDLRKLARNPVMLTCLCVIHYNGDGKLPHGRARVYRAILDWLLESRAEQRRADGYRDGLVQLALEELAVAMMKGTTRRPGKMATIDLGDAVRAIEAPIRRYFPEKKHPEGPRPIGERFLRRECELSSAIEQSADNKLQFWHLTVQEYLVALKIARSDDWRREVEAHLDDRQWDEVIALIPGCMFDAIGPSRVDDLLEMILDRDEGRGLLAEVKRLINLGRALAPLSAYGYELAPFLDERRADLKTAVMAIFTVEGAAQVPVALRIAAAEVIGRWGDPRFEEGVDNFVDVPGLGIALGRYPVTVREFQRFVEDKGYERRELWDEDGQGWLRQLRRRQPWNWQAQVEHPTRPVFGVCWHEARAYCRWLQGHRGAEVRLPTADEWEHAATPPAGVFPWSKADAESEADEGEIAEHLANYNENVSAPTPVGVYPAGAGPFEHVDLAGNVWEWCEDGPSDKEEFRWLKGGSWYHDGGALAAAYRSGSWLDVDYGYVGFRVLVSREPVDP